MLLEDFMTAKDAAREIGVEYKTLLMRLSRGKIVCEEVGYMKLIHKDVVAEEKVKQGLRNKIKKRKRHPLLSTWRNMINRCKNPNHQSYKRYGARGIKVCQAWIDSFEQFCEDVGKRPKGKSLDRYPDPDGDYEPGNIRWATRKEQRNNQGTRS